MSNKRFKLKADQICQLIPKLGGCMATDMITVDGRKVAFMYREATSRDLDSGWRFFSGYESDDYANDPKNVETYEVNTIANYDPDIIPFLNAPAGSAFERTKGTGPFQQVDFQPPTD